MQGMIPADLAAHLRQILTPIRNELIRAKRELAEVKAIAASRPRTITEEIDAIPGRRIFYTLSAVQTFDAALDGRPGQVMSFLVSQDGPFIMTHYPVAMWRSSSPDTATTFGRWRPVASWPLPDQVLDDDIIDISYSMADAGSQRNFQNLPILAGLLSRPDNMIPLPVPTLFTPNTTIQFIPQYENILFSVTAVPTTQGTLVVALPGYRIVSL